MASIDDPLRPFGADETFLPYLSLPLRSRLIARLTELPHRVRWFAATALVCYWLLIFAGTHLSRMPAMVEHFPDKLLHFVAFAGLGILLVPASYIISRRRSLQRFLWLALIMVVYGILDESTQAFVVGRTPDTRDFQADMCGAVVGLGVWFAIHLSVALASARQITNPSWATQRVGRGSAAHFSRERRGKATRAK